MQSWHPISKLAIGLGLLGLGVVWWTDQGGTGDSAQAEDMTTTSALATAAPAATNGAPVATVSSPPAKPLEARVLPAVDTLEAMVTRPLFAPDRRAYDPEVEISALPYEEWAPEPEAGPAQPAFRFIGSIEEEARLRALVSDGFNVRAIGEGEAVDGWVVVAIESRRLTLGLDDERLELTIFE